RDTGQNRRATHAYGKTCLSELANCVYPQVGARGARLENPRQVDIQGGYRDMDRQQVILRDLAKKVEIADDEIGFGDDPQLEAAMTSELFENAARDFVAALGGLVGIGCGAERNPFPRL